MTEQKPIKIYVAILNDGWVHTAVAFSICPDMFKIPGVSIVMEDPSITWHRPISSNRNKIVQRFLTSDCAYLLMMDADVIPLHNPIEMVFAGKDVIAMPIKIRQSGLVMEWTSYIKYQVGEGYSYGSVNLDAIDDNYSILQVDAVGTGCILIKRGVLEGIKAPFNCKYNDDGICTTGTDIAFCERVKEKGFEVYTTTHKVCEHIKKVGLLQTMSFSDEREETAIPHKLGLHWGEMAINWPEWKFIKNIIQRNNVKEVLEFGAGLSSLLIQKYTNILSLETNGEYKKIIESHAAKDGYKLDIQIWDGKKAVEFPNKFDLVFIDGPSSKRVPALPGVGRECSFATAAKCTDRIIIHDADRDEERILREKYLVKDFKVAGRSGYLQQSCVYMIRR